MATLSEVKQEPRDDRSGPVLPYDPDALTWNAHHTQNEQHRYCYCGKDFCFKSRAFYCERCRNWFHYECISEPPSPWAVGQVNYRFTCANCNEGTEHIELGETSFRSGAIAALNALHAEKEEDEFSSEQISQWLQENWEAVRSSSRSRSNLQGTVVSTLRRLGPSVSERGDSRCFRMTHLEDFVNWLPSTHKLKMATTGSHKSKRRHTEPTQSNDHAARRAKKEVLQDAHAFNQERFRFYSAEADPYRPNHWRLCGYDRPLALSEQDKAQQLTLLDDNAVLVGSKGYCSARAGLGVAHGCWYWEVEVLPRATPLAPNYPEGHVRVGWSQGGCDVQYPCGFDGLSFSWRDKDGACFHRGRGDKTRLGEQGAFGPGDVLGLAIELPGQESLLDLSPAPPEAEAVDLKGLAYLETTLVTRVDEVCVGSRMMCYKNGQLLGSMALDVPKGRYYPTVSLYFNSQVRVNFGPKLRYPPTDGRFRPLAEFVPRYNAGLALFDAVQEAVNRVDQTASTAAAPTPVPARPAPLTKPA